jgi:hypothetical protein
VGQYRIKGPEKRVRISRAIATQMEHSSWIRRMSEYGLTETPAAHHMCAAEG